MKKNGKRNRNTDEVVAMPTQQHFNLLIKQGNSSVSWVGNYTMSPRNPKIEIGFLKKEAMPLTTLMSCYNHFGNAPVIFGVLTCRKLAIFHYRPDNSPQDDEEEDRRWSTDRIDLTANTKIPRSQPVSLAMMTLLAQLGRADIYLKLLKEKLGKEASKKRGRVVSY